MTKPQLEQLIDRYLQGNASRKEKEMVESFYSHLIEQRGDLEDWNTQDKSQIKKRMYHKIQMHIQKSRRKKMRYILSAAAAVLLLLISGYLFVSQMSDKSHLPSISPTEIVAIAGSGQRSLLLNDGTYVLLSPGAAITYPSTFDASIRKVELTGEAWFDVQRDTIHPFQVITGEVVTTVLGTSFSINSSSERKSVEVNVTSGRVKVNSPEKELAVLEKDDQLVYQSGEFEVSRGISDEDKTEHLPKPGAFKLANVTMAEAASFLEKRWNQSITFDNPAIRNCPLYASFNAYDTLEEVLMILCGVSNSKYKTENGKIIIYGPGCPPLAGD